MNAILSKSRAVYRLQRIFVIYYATFEWFDVCNLCMIRSEEAEEELRCETYKRLRNVSHADCNFVKFRVSK